MAGGNQNFKELQTNIFAALVETTRTVGLIVREDLAFHRSSNPSVGPLLDRQASRLLNLAQGLLKIATLGTEVPTPQIQDADAVEENWGGVVDVVDNLLEKTDACLDEYTGVIKISTPLEDTRATAIDTLKKRSLHQISVTPHVAKPQNGFLRAPNNNEKTPFKPLLRSKPHAILPLTQSLTRVTGDDGLEGYESHITFFGGIYEYFLMHCTAGTQIPTNTKLQSFGILMRCIPNLIPLISRPLLLRKLRSLILRKP